MSAVTAWAVASRVGGIGQYLSPTGRLAGAHAYEKLERDLPPEGIEVTLGHDGPAVGDLVHVEVTSDDRVHAVVVLDDFDIARADFPVYLSGEFLCVGGDLDRRVWISERAHLCGLALVTDPGSHDARPLQWRHGDIRRDTYNWPMSWKTETPLLKRAADNLRGIETRARKVVVHDARPEYEIERMAPNALLIDGELVMTRGAYLDYPDRRPPGELEFRPARILSVR